MSNRSVIANGVLDALGARRDITSDSADVLADAAHGVASTQADQHGGSDKGEEEFIHIAAHLTERVAGVSSEVQCELPVPVEFDSERPSALMSSPNPRMVLQLANPAIAKQAANVRRKSLMSVVLTDTRRVVHSRGMAGQDPGSARAVTGVGPSDRTRSCIMRSVSSRTGST